MATLYSKAKVLGHPVHPMLVAFPITFFTSTLIASIVYLATNDRDWFRLAYFANAAGVVTALIAAVPGFLDWTGIPSHLRAKQVGVVHLTLNLITVAIFTLNLGMQGAQLGEAAPSGWSAFVLSLLGVMLLLVSGYYGFSLTQTHHVLDRAARFAANAHIGRRGSASPADVVRDARVRRFTGESARPRNSAAKENSLERAAVVVAGDECVNKSRGW